MGGPYVLKHPVATGHAIDQAARPRTRAHAGRQRRLTQESNCLGATEAGVFPDRYRRRREGGRVCGAATEAGSFEKISALHLRVRRAGRANDGESLVRPRRHVALAAGAAGIRGDEHRQPRHHRAARQCLAQEHLPTGRHPCFQGSGCCRAAGVEGSPLPRFRPRGRVGLERRRLNDPQRALSVSRSVSRGHLYRARAESAALRHHLSGTLHGPAGR